MDVTDVLAVLHPDRRAASPLIGIVLLVAITVVLSAIVGTFVLGIEQETATEAPSATFAFAFDDAGDGYANSNDWIFIRHTSGDYLDADQIDVVIDGRTVTGLEAHWTSRITPSDSVSITDHPGPTAAATAPAIEAGDEVRIIWRSADSDVTVTIAVATVS